jgi:hypothetical protein
VGISGCSGRLQPGIGPTENLAAWCGGRQVREMDLAAAVKRYLEFAGGFERSMHLSEFGLPQEETEKMNSAWDEDYQISRHMLLWRERDETLTSYLPDLRVFLINGYECTHLSFHAGIQILLERCVEALGIRKSKLEKSRKCAIVNLKRAIFNLKSQILNP